ncbi:hypothetical protein IEQ34_002937 [Dendrobium chrysotoxum]|uniref:Uncharacterized protein n=1 Tax=Dendrobium chrysotoxum TaxID=161865 RepID=A0AAV7HIE1_DENCH|nr:hypothetical protein IEQ34_002937 [Dendrobium chrysotoxum]
MGSLNFEVDDEEIAAKRRAEFVPGAETAEEATEWELRVQLFDGSILNGILRMLNTGAVDEIRYADYVPSERRPEILKLFLSVVNNLGLPSFQVADLEKVTCKLCYFSCKISLERKTVKSNNVMYVSVDLGNFSAVLNAFSPSGATSIPQLGKTRACKLGSGSIGKSLVWFIGYGIHSGQSSPVFGDDKKSSWLKGSSNMPREVLSPQIQLVLYHNMLEINSMRFSS